MNKIVICAIAFALIMSGLLIYAAYALDAKNIPAYQKMLFNGEVATIDIQIDEAEWQSMMNNATAKEYVTGDVIINGDRFGSIGVRTKGNSSLSQNRGSDDGSYSLHFKMNYAVKGQTYYGLDVFCVNNMMGDATYMKDYIAYDIMRYVGVDAPLTNYAKITVNGEDYGFGPLLERYEKAYLDRVYDTSAGLLYSVKIQMGQRDNFMEFGRAIPEENTRPNQSAGNADRANRGRGGMGGFGGFGGSNGGSLVYTTDELGNYSSIFDNAIFSAKTTQTDMRRVVTAIKDLNEGTNLEQYWDIDAILRYLAAHTVVVNLDSYTSSMQQNYYIYENNGKIIVLPWDYGLAFGGFQSGDASSVVNFPIDTPVSGVSMEDRPLINKLLEVPEYKEKYHEYLRQIVDGYFNSGLFENAIRELDEKINKYASNDISANYTHEQYEASLPVFIELGRLRAESIAGQLGGTIPSTTDGQRADPSALVNSSIVNLSALGSMMGGGGMGGARGNFDGNMPDMPDRGQWGVNGQMPNMPGGGQDRFGGQPPNNRGGFNGQQPGNMPDYGND
jgi:spore coat protein CotH